MTGFESLVLGVSPYVTAGIALAGSLIGGAIAGTVSLTVARQTREAAERAWVRDNRREIYDRYLTNGQKLLVECLSYEQAPRRRRSAEQLEEAYNNFFEVYGVVQTVAERPVVDAARDYGYRLLELRDELVAKSVLDPKDFHKVAGLVRSARHDTIDAMRAELGLVGSARPEPGYNPFEGTEFEDEYKLSNHGSSR
jgi:hypothetical protein